MGAESPRLLTRFKPHFIAYAEFVCPLLDVRRVRVPCVAAAGLIPSLSFDPIPCDGVFFLLERKVYVEFC